MTPEQGEVVVVLADMYELMTATGSASMQLLLEEGLLRETALFLKRLSQGVPISKADVALIRRVNATLRRSLPTAQA